MDGIVTGLTSIVPLMPDQSVIPDRSGVKGPPVEIMPLPADSFMPEDATAEPLTIPLRSDRQGRPRRRPAEDPGTAPKSGRKNTRSRQLAPYWRSRTLSLGNEENIPAAAGIRKCADESYELLGKTAYILIGRRRRRTTGSRHRRRLRMKVPRNQSAAATGACCPGLPHNKMKSFKPRKRFLCRPMRFPGKTPDYGSRRNREKPRPRRLTGRTYRFCQICAAFSFPHPISRPYSRWNPSSGGSLNMLSSVSSGGSAAPEDIPDAPSPRRRRRDGPSGRGVLAGGKTPGRGAQSMANRKAKNCRIPLSAGHERKKEGSGGRESSPGRSRAMKQTKSTSGSPGD